MTGPDGWKRPRERSRGPRRSRRSARRGFGQLIHCGSLNTPRAEIVFNLLNLCAVENFGAVGFGSLAPAAPRYQPRHRRAGTPQFLIDLIFRHSKRRQFVGIEFRFGRMLPQFAQYPPANTRRAPLFRWACAATGAYAPASLSSAPLKLASMNAEKCCGFAFAEPVRAVHLVQVRRV